MLPVVDGVDVRKNLLPWEPWLPAAADIQKNTEKKEQQDPFYVYGLRYRFETRACTAAKT
jgi:hypothetical protein